jgi:porphobilinogen deaminase
MNLMRAKSELLPHRKVLADYFPTSSHNDLRNLPSNHRPGTFSSRRFSAKSGQQRPKLRVTPYPGIFCRELLCFDDFKAQPFL